MDELQRNEELIAAYLRGETPSIADVPGLRWQDAACLCWVGHGSCGGCSGVIGITHEPACGWEWNPDCPVHRPEELGPTSEELGPNLSGA